MGAFPTSDLPGHENLHKRVCASLDYCEESRNIEFKRSAPWTDLKLKIIKTAMAMANLRDGGLIIIGVSEQGDTWELAGIDEEHLSTFDPDVISSDFHRYASPHIEFTAVRVKHTNGRIFLAISVDEFDETPVVNKKAYDGEMRRGEMFVRKRGPVRTEPITDARDMHDALVLAAEKRAKRIIQTSKNIGLGSSVGGEQAHGDKILDTQDAGGIVTEETSQDVVTAAKPSNANAIDTAEVGFANEVVLMDKMRTLPALASIPRIRIIIRPEEYAPARISSISELWRTVEDVRIKRMGWDYPLLLRSDEYRSTGNNWIGAQAELSGGPQEWKMFQSGQFVHDMTIRGCSDSNRKAHEEWARHHHMVPPDSDWGSVVGYVGIEWTMITCALVVELASRLCQKGIIEGRCSIALSMESIQGTVLVADPRRAWHDTFIAKVPSLNNTWHYPVDALIADPISPPIDMAVWFFERYGWLEPPKEVIQKVIDDLRAGR